MKNSFGVFVLCLSLFVSADAVAKRKKGERKIASVIEQCKALVGESGEHKDLEKIFEVYFEGCLAASDSTAEMDFPSTAYNLAGRIQPIMLKVKQNKVPFVYTRGGYEYHMYQGDIVGVTRAR